MRALASRSKEQSTPLKKGGLRTQPVHASPLFSQSTGVDSGVVQRKAGCACGGDCPKCRSELGIQAKLKVGAPNDKYEQEADQVAERIVSGGHFSPTKVDHAHNHVQRGMSDGVEEEEETEANAVQRKANSDGNSKMSSGTSPTFDHWVEVVGRCLGRKHSTMNRALAGHSKMFGFTRAGRRTDRPDRSMPGLLRWGQISRLPMGNTTATRNPGAG